MPQIPVLIPIIATGLLVGSIMIHEGHKISKKRLGTASVISGLLNGAQAYLVNTLMPASTTRGGGGGAFIAAGGGGAFVGGGTIPSAAITAAAAARQTTELTYYISSVLVGILIPLVILGIGLFRARSKGSDEEVEPEDMEPEEVEPEDSTHEK
jgi:hypothetical protein